MALRLSKLRENMVKQGLQAMLVTSPFNRRFLSGFTGSAGYLIITEDRAQLITDFRYVEQAAEQASEFEIIRHGANILDELANQLERCKVVKVGFEKQLVSYSLYESLKKCAEDIEWIGTAGFIEELRMVKTPEEVLIIKEACQIADNSFDHILKYIKPGITEREVSIELEFHMRRQGATSSSFDIIVASGSDQPYRMVWPVTK